MHAALYVLMHAYLSTLSEREQTCDRCGPLQNVVTTRRTLSDVGAVQCQVVKF